jgi:hypothetical protein
MRKERMDFQKVFFREFEEEFWSVIGGGFRILAKKCVYAI